MDFIDLGDVIDLEILEEIEEIENRRDRRPKVYKLRYNPFDLDDCDFKNKYRFTKPYAQRIIDILRADLQKDNRGSSISPELQVLSALRTWARAEIQDDSGDIHGFSQSSVTNICRRVALALVNRREEYIKMPQTLAEEEQVVAEFRQIAGFRHVVGAIDCTHIRIPKVGGDVAQYYINRKGYSSLNVQVVCDASLRIRNIVAAWRGSTHDARIFNESRIKQRMENGEFRGRLLGDSGYACTPYLFTPVLAPRMQSEERYNYAHIRTQNTVERCFGVWKQRFRCLLNGFTTSLENTKLYIVALAILHNIAIDMSEGGNYLPDDDCHNDVVVPPAGINVNGNAARSAFIEQYFLN